MTNCIKFEGRPVHYQAEALDYYLNWTGEPVAPLSWVIVKCDEPMCLNAEHMAIHKPQKLMYPHGICVYCGKRAGTRDHIMPVTWTGKSHRKSVLTVPACGECNSIIGADFAPTITERRTLAHAGIRRKYKATLRTHDFTAEDLEEFEGALRIEVEGALVAKQFVLERLSWPPLDYDHRAIEHTGFDAYELGLLLPAGSEPGTSTV